MDSEAKVSGPAKKRIWAASRLVDNPFIFVEPPNETGRWRKVVQGGPGALPSRRASKVHSKATTGDRHEAALGRQREAEALG